MMKMWKKSVNVKFIIDINVRDVYGCLLVDSVVGTIPRIFLIRVGKDVEMK